MADETILRDALLAHHGLSAEDFKETGLQWEMLDAIRTSHIAETSDLSDSAEYLYKRLLTLPAVHSLKVRVKDPNHLVAKVIRKKIKEPELEITPDNYREHITDLVGIRALHLFKHQWLPIHEFVMNTWGLELLREQPIAYVRVGDAGSIIDEQKRTGCRVEEHPFGYRSVHYLVKSQPAKVARITELQVRTVFEEGWSEIDHQVRYPRKSGNPLLSELTVLFNRLAGSADEMGTFINLLSVYLQEQTANQIDQQQRLLDTEAVVTKLIQESKASKEEKADLQREVAKLRKQVANSTLIPDYSSMTISGMADLGEILSGSLARFTITPEISSHVLDAYKYRGLDAADMLSRLRGGYTQDIASAASGIVAPKSTNPPVGGPRLCSKCGNAISGTTVSGTKSSDDLCAACL